jgi:hypothetical protein
VAALKQVPTQVPMVVRLVGTNEQEGRAILAGAKMQTADTLVEAAQKAVAAAKGEEYVPAPPTPPVAYKPKARTIARPVVKKPVRPVARKTAKKVSKQATKKAIQKTTKK